MRTRRGGGRHERRPSRAMSAPACPVCARRARAKLAPLVEPRLRAAAAVRRGRSLTGAELADMGGEREAVMRALGRLREERPR